MKLEGRTLQILKNYCTINPSLQFKQGNHLTTVSPTKTLMAKAEIKEDIPSTFAIYDLSRFLGVLSLFDSPSIVLDEKFLNIQDSNRSVQYTFADPKLIVTPGEKEISFPDPEIKFTLTSSVLQDVLKAMSIMSLPELAVSGRDGKMYVEAINTHNPTSDKFSVQVGETQDTFKMIFLAENIKIIVEDYSVGISSRGIAHFKGSDIQYWIATESSSTFNK